MFRAAGRDVAVAGNVGRALTGVDAPPDAWIVCELSSFQLEDVHEFRPRIAVLLNLEPDHLDRHGTFEAYRDAKLRIFENQTADDAAVVPRGFGPVGGAGRRIEFAARRSASRPSRGLPGAHNRENAAAATAAARAAGVADEAIAEALRVVPGRRRTGSSSSRELGGVRFVNDSKATNTAAARRALAAVRRAAARDPRRLAQGRVVRRARARGRTAARYLIGEAADELAAALDRAGVPYERCGDLADGGRGRRGRGPAGRRRPALAGLRELRPVPGLRAARRGVQEARAEPVRVKRGHTRVEHPRPRHARPRRLRDGDGVQRDLGLRGARRRQPDLLPQAPGALRAGRARRCSSSPRAGTTSRCGTSRRCSSSGASSLLLAVLVAGESVNGARRWIQVGGDHLPALGAREARARGLGRRCTSRDDARRERSSELANPIGLRRRGLLRARPRRARPRAP